MDDKQIDPMNSRLLIVLDGIHMIVNAGESCENTKAAIGWKE